MAIASEQRVYFVVHIVGHLYCLAGKRSRRSDGFSEDRQGDKVQVPTIRADRRGFTVAELLIVVAIIAVLVGVAIPVFNNQAEQAREATDLANVRSAYAEVMNTAIVEDKASSLYNTKSQTFEKAVSLKQAVRGWSMDAKQLVVGGIARGSSGWRGVPSANGTATVSYSLSTRQAIIKWGGEDHINKVSAGDFLIKETLLDVLKENYSHTVVNSNESYAQGEGTQKITDFFNKQGINLADYGAATWQMYVQESKKDESGKWVNSYLEQPAIYWSTVELDKNMVADGKKNIRSRYGLSRWTL